MCAYMMLWLAMCDVRRTDMQHRTVTVRLYGGFECELNKQRTE